MIFRSVALASCLAVLCLSLIVGCAPPVSSSSSSGTFQASPATTVPPTDAPSLAGPASPGTTTPQTEVLNLGQ